MILPDRWRAVLSGTVFSWTLFLVYNTLVFCVAVIPGPNLPEIVSSFNDKFLHALEYFLLFAVTVHALKTLPPHLPPVRFRGLTAVSWSLSVGILAEVLQTQTAGRSGDPADAAANGAGILFAYAVWKMIMQKRKQNEEGERSNGNL